MPSRKKALGLRQGNLVEPLLIGSIEIDCHLFDAGGYHEQLRPEVVRQKRGDKILVDHGLESIETAGGIFYDGNAAATAGDDDMTLVDQ